MKKNRYPGIHSFTEAEREQFFGRDRETKELYRLLVLNPVLVLFGKSGTGKTSLLQAGVSPLLHQRGLQPIKIRLNDTAKPIARQIFEQFNAGEYLPEGTPDNLTLSEYCRLFDCVRGGESLAPVLLLDQFEELFTLYGDLAEQRETFIAQLTELINLPNIGGGGPNIPSDGESQGTVRIVISIRSDFLYLLDRLSGRIPAILRCRYELRPLDEASAKEAIIQPARLGGDFASNPFSFAPAALDDILNALGAPSDTGEGTREVEAFLLQQFCQHIEGKLMAEIAPAGFEVTPAFFGGQKGIEAIRDAFYQTVLDKVAPESRLAAQRLVEEKLISAERRIIAERENIKRELQLDDATIALLCRERLLREEPRGGAFYYEISHDTLLGTILRSREERLEKEEKTRIESEKAEADRRRRNALLTSAMAGLLILAAMGASVFAFFQNQEARESAKLAEQKTYEADSLTRFSREQYNRAVGAELNAQAKTEAANIAEQQANNSKKLAELKTKEAKTASDLAEIKKLEAEKANLQARALLEASQLMAAHKLPENFDALITLDSLKCSNWRLGSLSSEIGKLQKLTKLDLQGNQLTGLPLEIGNLQKLTNLDLRGNLLTSLPPEIGNLQKLTNLDLRGNKFTNLPTEIYKLQNLTELALFGNQLTNLPPEIGNLQKLTELVLVGSQLTNLPPEIGNLQKLTKLDLRDNQLTSLPPEIGNLQKLTKLLLWSNKLTSLPSEIGNLQNLTELALQDNQLTNLPPEIYKLQNLTSLNLSENDLMRLPPEIGNLQKLTNLNLWGNQFTNLPPEICKLQNLTSLNLSENDLMRLPPEIVKLQNLTSLDLWGNKLRSLPPEIVKLQNLTELYLGEIELTSVPPEIGNLQKLTELSLRYNGLQNLSPEIGNLQKLSSLDLSGNQLTSLPPEIGNLQKLKKLSLKGNPISKTEQKKIKSLLPNCKIEF